MTTTPEIDAWAEKAIVTLNLIGSANNYEMAAMSKDIDLIFGDRRTDFIATTDVRRITKKMPEAQAKVRITAYVLNVGAAESGSATLGGLMNLFYGTPTGATGTLSLTSAGRTASTDRKIRLSILWTENFFNGGTAPTSATGALAGTVRSMRIILADGYPISFRHEMTQGILQVTFEVDFAPLDRDGNGCYKFQSTEGDSAAGTHAALSTYTTSNKF